MRHGRSLRVPPPVPTSAWLPPTVAPPRGSSPWLLPMAPPLWLLPVAPPLGCSREWYMLKLSRRHQQPRRCPRLPAHRLLPVAPPLRCRVLPAVSTPLSTSSPTTHWSTHKSQALSSPSTDSALVPNVDEHFKSSRHQTPRVTSPCPSPASPGHAPRSAPCPSLLRFAALVPTSDLDANTRPASTRHLPGDLTGKAGFGETEASAAPRGPSSGRPSAHWDQPGPCISAAPRRLLH